VPSGRTPSDALLSLPVRGSPLQPGRVFQMHHTCPNQSDDSVRATSVVLGREPTCHGTPRTGRH
jgi:hypothetical protein